jgi:hypothetical protein
MRALRLLLVLLAAPVAAAEFVVPEIYPAATAAWTTAIGGALAHTAGAPALSPSLAPLSAPGLIAPAHLLAPVVAQLSGPLAITPSAFAALPLEEQRAALDLATDGAREALQQKTYELDALSRSLSAPDRDMDRDARVALFGVVAQLQEMHGRYGPLLDETEKGVVEEAYGRALVRAVQVRNALMGRSLQQTAAELTALRAGHDESGAAANAAAPDPTKLPGVSPKAAKLYSDMTDTTAGWSADDVDAMLTGYGFVRRDSKHRNYRHPDFPDMADSVPHQRVLKDVYVKSATRLVRELARRRAQSAAPAAPETTAAAPAVARAALARVSLLDFRALLADPRPAEPEADAAAPAPGETAAAPAEAARAPALAPAARAPAALVASAVRDAPPAAPEEAARPASRLAPAAPATAPEPVKAEPPAPAAAEPSRPASWAPRWLKNLLGMR